MDWINPAGRSKRLIVFYRNALNKFILIHNSNPPVLQQKSGMLPLATWMVSSDRKLMQFYDVGQIVILEVKT